MMMSSSSLSTPRGPSAKEAIEQTSGIEHLAAPSNERLLDGASTARLSLMVVDDDGTVGVAASDSSSDERRRWTALHYACHNGAFDVAQLLVVGGAPLFAQSARGETPLHTLLRAFGANRHANAADDAAATRHCVRLMQHVVEKASALTTIADARGCTPFNLAVQSGVVEFPRVLWPHLLGSTSALSQVLSCVCVCVCVCFADEPKENSNHTNDFQLAISAAGFFVLLLCIYGLSMSIHAAPTARM
jgi:ankyrin repeat protein